MLILRPAYGREYRNSVAVESDWERDRDFQSLRSESVINKTDADCDVKLTLVCILFDGQRKAIAFEKQTSDTNEITWHRVTPSLPLVP